MIKEITLSVPKYVKRFLMSESDYEQVSNSIIRVPRRTEIGQLIFGFSRIIPETEEVQERIVPKGYEVITFRYNCKKKAYDVPFARYTAITACLIQVFRSSLIREVSAIHSLRCEDDYGWIVRFFLSRRGISVDDAEDKDIEWEAVKKIYRDHLDRVSKKNSEKRKLSRPVPSGLQPFCQA